MFDHYILNADGEPERVPIWSDEGIDVAALRRWDEWYEKAENKIVRRTTVGGIRVSTVFLALDHQFGDDGPPLLWETMCFDDAHPKVMTLHKYTGEGEEWSVDDTEPPRTFRFHPELSEFTRRYSSKAGALAGHEEAVRILAMEHGDPHDITAETIEAMRSHSAEPEPPTEPTS